MNNNKRNFRAGFSRAGFSRVDAGMLLIVTFLALLMSYLTDRIFRNGENLTNLLEWLDETNAELKRGVTADQLRELLGTNLHSTADWDFIFMACGGFALVVALLLAINVTRRISRRFNLARLSKAKPKHGRRAEKLLKPSKRRAA